MYVYCVLTCVLKDSLVDIVEREAAQEVDKRYVYYMLCTHTTTLCENCEAKCIELSVFECIEVCVHSMV